MYLEEIVISSTAAAAASPAAACNCEAVKSYRFSTEVRRQATVFMTTACTVQYKASAFTCRDFSRFSTNATQKANGARSLIDFQLAYLYAFTKLTCRLLRRLSPE